MEVDMQNIEVAPTGAEGDGAAADGDPSLGVDASAAGDVNDGDGAGDVDTMGGSGADASPPANTDAGAAAKPARSRNPPRTGRVQVEHRVPFVEDGSRRTVAQRHVPRNPIVHPKGFKVLAKRSVIERSLKSYFRLPAPVAPKTLNQLESVRKQITILEHAQKRGTFESSVGRDPGASKRKKKKKGKAWVLDGFRLLNVAKQSDPAAVKEVHLPGLELRKVVHDDLVYFENLEFIDAGENELDVADFASLPRLHELHLHCNGLKDLGDGVRGYPTLDTLNLSYNVLTGRTLRALLHIHTLQRLDLSNNPILVLPHDMSGLRNLSHLALEKTGLDHTCFAPLSTLPNLQEVNLSYNAISGWWLADAAVARLGCTGPNNIEDAAAARALFPKGRPQEAIAAEASRREAAGATDTQAHTGKDKIAAAAAEKDKSGRKAKKKKNKGSAESDGGGAPAPPAPASAAASGEQPGGAASGAGAVPATADASLAPPSEGAGLGLKGLPPIAPPDAAADAPTAAVGSTQITMNANAPGEARQQQPRRSMMTGEVRRRSSYRPPAHDAAKEAAGMAIDAGAARLHEGTVSAARRTSRVASKAGSAAKGSPAGADAAMTAGDVIVDAVLAAPASPKSPTAGGMSAPALPEGEQFDSFRAFDGSVRTSPAMSRALDPTPAETPVGIPLARDDPTAAAALTPADAAAVAGGVPSAFGIHGGLCFPKLATVGLVGNPIDDPRAMAGFLTLPNLLRVVLWRTPLCRNGMYCQRVVEAFSAFEVTVELDPSETQERGGGGDRHPASGDADADDIPKAISYRVPRGEMHVVKPFPPPPKLFRHRSHQTHGDPLRMGIGHSGRAKQIAAAPQPPAQPRPPEAIDDVDDPPPPAADTQSFFFITETDAADGGDPAAAARDRPLPPGVPSYKDILRQADEEMAQRFGGGRSHHRRPEVARKPAQPESLGAAFVDLKRLLVRNAPMPAAVAPAPKNSDTRAQTRRRRVQNTMDGDSSPGGGASTMRSPMQPANRSSHRDPTASALVPHHAQTAPAAATSANPGVAAKGIRLPPLGDASTPSTGMASVPNTTRREK